MKHVYLIMGCTACGKGEVGRLLAQRVGGEIVSVDSMKVYRRMDIGTAKPTLQHRRQVRHHLIDVVEPSESFSVARYVQLADAAISEIASRGKVVLAVGGTHLYIKALTEGLFDAPPADPRLRQRLREEASEAGSERLHARLMRVDPAAAQRIHPNDLRRIVRALEVYEQTGRPISELQRQWGALRTEYRFTFIGLRRGIEDLNHRINTRVKRMIQQGLVEEVRALLAEPGGLSEQARQGLGYAEIIEHLAGRMGLDEAVERIKINTRRFAKSQRTWLRRFADLIWFDVSQQEPPERTVDRILSAVRFEPAGGEGE